MSSFHLSSYFFYAFFTSILALVINKHSGVFHISSGVELNTVEYSIGQKNTVEFNIELYSTGGPGER